MSEISKTFRSYADKLDLYDLTEKNLAYIRAHREEAIPYYLEKLRAVDWTLPDEEEVHGAVWPGIFFLAECHVTEAFPVYLQIMAMDADAGFELFDMNWLYTFPSLLYATWNGPADTEAAFRFQLSRDVDPIHKGTVSMLFEKLYFDGIMSREELVEKTRRLAASFLEYEQDPTPGIYPLLGLQLEELREDIEKLQASGLVEKDSKRRLMDVVELPGTWRNTRECASMEKALMYGGTAPEDVQQQVEEEQEARLVPFVLPGKTLGCTLAEHQAHYEEELRIRKEREEAEKAERKRFEGVGRNAPCPCGSGKKFKNCCLSKFR